MNNCNTSRQSLVFLQSPWKKKKKEKLNILLLFIGGLFCYLCRPISLPELAQSCPPENTSAAAAPAHIYLSSSTCSRASVQLGGPLNHLSPACCVQTSKINNKKCRCARESVSCDHSLVNPRMNFYCHSAVFAAIAGYIDMKCCQNTRKGYVTDGLRLHYSAYGCAFVHTFGLTPLPRCFPSRKNTTPPADRTTRVNQLLSGINPCCV